MADRLFKRTLPNDNITRRFVDMRDDTHAERVQALAEADTAFMQGYAFRTFYEFDLDIDDVAVIKAATTGDTVLEFLDVTIISGQIRVETYAADGTENGTYSETLPVLPVNSMSEVPTPTPTTTVTLTSGGGYTGGTLLDIALLKTDTNSNKARVVDFHTGAARAVPAGTYYYKVTAIGASEGVFSARWHEHAG